jgi:hypothetical protein
LIGLGRPIRIVKVLGAKLDPERQQIANPKRFGKLVPGNDRVDALIEPND